jgi:hypothetical protein
MKRIFVALVHRQASCPFLSRDYPGFVFLHAAVTTRRSDTCTVVGMVLVNCKMYAVKFIDPVIRSKPHITVAVFVNGIDGVGRKSVFTAEVDKTEIVFLCA